MYGQCIKFIFRPSVIKQYNLKKYILEAEEKSIESIEDHPHGYPSEEVPNKNSFTYRGHFQGECCDCLS